MSIAYFIDTSAITKRYITEIGSVWVDQNLRVTSGNTIFVLDITAVEFVSALTRRAKGGLIPKQSSNSAQSDFINPDGPNLSNVPLSDGTCVNKVSYGH